jgi:hypothetical protein
MRLSAVFAFVLLYGAMGLGVAAEPPAAMVMAITGGSDPELSPMSEIPSGQHVHLSATTEITVFDYARCKMVTVVGGTLTVTRFDFDADGKIVREIEAPCPRIHELSGNGDGAVAGGFVARGIESTPAWPLNRELILGGSATDGLSAAAIYAEGQLDTPLVKLEVTDHRAVFPAGATALEPNRRYVLRVTAAGKSIDIAFVGKAPSGQSLLVVLRRQ